MPSTHLESDLRIPDLNTVRQAIQFLFIVVTLSLISTSNSLAQSFDEDFSIWPIDLKINGVVIACSGPKVNQPVVDLFKRAAGKESKIVALWMDTEFKADSFEDVLDEPTTFGKKDDSQIDANKLKKSLRDATGVLIFSSKPTSAKANKTLEVVQQDLKDVIQRGGVVCAVGPVISNLGAFRHDEVDFISVVRKDLGLIPDSILYESFDDDSDRKKMYGGLASEPHSVAIGVPSDTAVVLRGRKCITLGKQNVTFVITANERQPYRIQHLADTTGKRISPYKRVVDLTAWRRDAIERQLPAFPEPKPPVPVVEKGTLFIVGGGGTPRGLMTEMVKLAGGKEAHMVYVPCTERETVPENHAVIRQWKRMGVASAKIFHTKDRNVANSDKEFLETMKKATGVWFGGGRQWNFADSYYGTEAHRLMKDVLARGGVIGGSSAGASIQGGYLARANPVANFDIMAPGYERGLGFLPGVAIDQHFTQRGRQKDMTQLADRYPQLLGIGIDESTAIRVQGSKAEVIGNGKVFFYDRRKPVVPGEKDYLALSKGQSLDLQKREVVDDDQ